MPVALPIHLLLRDDEAKTIGGCLLQQNLLEAAGLLALRDRLLVDQVVLLIATMTIRREQNAERWLAIPQNLRRGLARLRRRGLECARCDHQRLMAGLGVGRIDDAGKGPGSRPGMRRSVQQKDRGHDHKRYSKGCHAE